MAFMGRTNNDNEHTKYRSKFDYDNQNDLVNGTLSKVSNSGNSDVDVNTNIDVHIDVMPIALAILYSSLANKQLSKKQFQYAMKKLDEYKSN